MEVDGISLTMGGAAVSAIAGVFGAWIKAKFGKARIDRVADGQQKILDKLDEMDSRSEKRARETHERIDPLVKELAKNIGQVELMKETFIQAAIGGKK